MFPVGDDRVSGGPAPLVTLGLVVLNVLVFLFEVSQPPGALQSFIQAWGVVPREYTLARDLAPTIPLPFWTTLITSMFLHGGWMHLGGNMLYLWIFGDNLEKTMGHARFAVFYLACGIAAGLAHILFSSASSVPHNRVRVLTRGGIMSLPAIAVLGFWIVIQLINGLGSLAVRTETGGVAYMAHVGGFIAGVALVRVMARRAPAIV